MYAAHLMKCLYVREEKKGTDFGSLSLLVRLTVSLFNEWGKTPLTCFVGVFLMFLGLLPAGFYSLLPASQIRRTLAYFNSFLGSK